MFECDMCTTLIFNKFSPKTYKTSKFSCFKNKTNLVIYTSLYLRHIRFYVAARNS